MVFQEENKACDFTKSNTPPWVFFKFSKLCKCHQIAQSIIFDRGFHFISFHCRVLIKGLTQTPGSIQNNLSLKHMADTKQNTCKAKLMKSTLQWTTRNQQLLARQQTKLMRERKIKKSTLTAIT